MSLPPDSEGPERRLDRLVPELVKKLLETGTKNLSPELLRQLSPEALRQLSPEILRHLSPETLRNLSPELLKNLSPELLKHLSPELLRQVAKELKLPKEVLQYTISHLDETKNGLYRSLLRELRDLRDRTSLADEIARALSLLTLEVKMEVRFKPSNIPAPSKTPVGAKVRLRRSESPEADSSSAAHRPPAAKGDAERFEEESQESE